MIVGLQGEKGVGKTTTANDLMDYFNLMGFATIVDSFASPVYEIASVLTGESVEQIKENKTKPYMDFPCIPNVLLGMTRRELLQRIGTEVFRDSFHPDTWASILRAKHPNGVNGKYYIVIVDDNRFPNECKFLDLTIRLKRNFHSDGVGDNHSSENQELEHDFEFDLDKGTIEELSKLILEALGLK